MAEFTDLTSWKRLLISLETSEKVNELDLNELENIFDHLITTQIAPRLQKEYSSNLAKTTQLLKDLFDKLDLSDKGLLCSFLRLLKSFGHFRIAQITYNITPHHTLVSPLTAGNREGGGEDEEEDYNNNIHDLYFPAIKKAKWYDMEPLLPEAGDISWKSIMNHGLVKEEKRLLHACIELLSQKLHFYSILLGLDQYHYAKDLIRKNGGKVVEKLFELIRDVAYDDDTMIGLDSFLFNLLNSFTNQEQQAAIIDAIVQDLFKPYTLQNETRDEQVSKIFKLIETCVLDQTDLQNFLVTFLLEHLRCNIMRRKRRHSVESSDGGLVTLESLLERARDEKLDEALQKTIDIEVSAKSLQSKYISYWLKVVDQILSQRTLKANNSLKLLGTCSIMLITLSDIIDNDLTKSITVLMAKIVEYTAFNRSDKLFSTFDPLFLVELTKSLSERTSLLSTFDTPIQKFYKIYFNRYIQCCLLRVEKTELEKIKKFVEFVCDKNIGKDTSHLMQYICVQELATCLDGKSGNKLIELYLECARLCSKRMYKFIKRNLELKLNGENGEDDSKMDCLNDVAQVTLTKKAIVLEALVFILKIAAISKDQALLDLYGDLLLKLYNAIPTRIGTLISIIKKGRSHTNSNKLDSYIPRLLMLYKDHKDVIEGYLNYDLTEKLLNLIFLDESETPVENAEEVLKGERKRLYNQVKEKLHIMEVRSRESDDVYPLIINKQHGIVVDSSIVLGDVKKEKSCCHNYRKEMQTLHEVYDLIIDSCSAESAKKILWKLVSRLEKCDHLDHTGLLYLFLIFESLISRHDIQGKSHTPYVDSLRCKLPRISTSLIRISKLVELGPSIHIFTNPGTHKSSRGVQCCTYANCIKIYTQISMLQPPKITNSLLNDAMQICVSSNLIQYAKYSDRLHRFFIQLASAITGLLKSMSIGRKEEDIMRSSMPIFLSVFSNLMRCLIMASDRKKLEAQSSSLCNGHGGNGESKIIQEPHSDYEPQLQLLALDIGRILNSLSSLKVKLVDYAPHLISTYVKDIQRASCPDYVRLHLNEGIFRIFNLVDAHQKERIEELVESGAQRKTAAGHASGSLFEMIHARLDQASREIFRDMHDNYNRFHRYKGRC